MRSLVAIHRHPNLALDWQTPVLPVEVLQNDPPFIHRPKPSVVQTVGVTGIGPGPGPGAFSAEASWLVRLRMNTPRTMNWFNFILVLLLIEAWFVCITLLTSEEMKLNLNQKGKILQSKEN